MNEAVVDTRPLGSNLGLTSSVAKDGEGNVLLARLGTIFHQNAKRTGKVKPLTKLRAESNAKDTEAKPAGNCVMTGSRTGRCCGNA